MKKIFCIFFLTNTFLFGQIEKAPIKKEGEGPYTKLIIRGVTIIDGTGSPPTGPIDIVVENNKIVEIKTVGFPGVAIKEENRPKADKNTKVLDCTGKFLLPGFIDMHGHIGGKQQGTPAEYVFKLWMAHGITTIREPYCGNGLDWTLDQKARSEKNEITAPRILPYTAFGQGAKEEISTVNQAIEWVELNAKNGASGIKFFGAKPEIMAAALKRNKELGLRSMCHHAQLNVAHWNVLNSAEAGLTTMEHWYGLPEAMLESGTLQNYPSDYVYSNEQNRFEEAGKLWKQAAKPYSEKWNTLMEKLLKLDFTLDPTFNIYDANRDLMRTRTAE